MSSRRSSLRSNSLLELEGMGTVDTPGPEPTEEQLREVENEEIIKGG